MTQTPFERNRTRAAWKAKWRAANPDLARAQNRKDQAAWRARHPDATRVLAAERYAWERQRKLAAGWVPMSRSERGRLGALASARVRS